MNKGRTPARKVEENDVNDEIPPRVEKFPQGDQVPIVVRDFMRTNPPILLVFKVGDDPQEFLDEVHKIVHAMAVTFREKAEKGTMGSV
ncbi:hypothetical protein EJD97_005864 [Solanum chilense]|uniref:Uncharacterized protein n=1 Tax=Solanum chilense TaxID=4083 RepID=A0A6N2CGR4_SOLCI|nr:hypothetical protein EJD97_005864 [Solanum chilense]